MTRCHGRAWIHQEWLRLWKWRLRAWSTPHTAGGVRDLAFATMGLSFRNKNCCRKRRSTSQKNQLCQQMDQSGEEGFILRMTGDGDYNQRRRGMKRRRCRVIGTRDLRSDTTWPRGVSLKSMYANAQTLRNELEELELHLQSRSYSIIQ